MGKKALPIAKLFLLGMALVVIGFILPVFSSKIGSKTGLNFINLKKMNPGTIGALLVFVGAAAGIVFEFISVKNAKLIKLVCLVASIVGGIIFAMSFGDNPVTKAIGKGLLKHASVGFYLIVVGWVAAIVGYPSAD